jgi:very-short-patch-repair endonuclease
LLSWREQRLRAAGYTVLRFTDPQIENEPDRVVAVLAAALDSRRRSATIA